MRKGIPVSPGVAVGTAYCLHEIFVNPDTKRLEDREVTAELARYETARDKTAADLHALQRKVEKQVGYEAAAIFTVHESILYDTAFSKKIRLWIAEDRMPAPAALHRLMAEYTELLDRTKDDYLKDRLHDVRDVVVRLSAHLSDVITAESTPLPGPLIVVANELLPSQAVALGKIDVQGIVTQAGSQTSHAAILARSRGIPAVAGVVGVLRVVNTGDTIVVNGRDGVVDINPGPEALAAHRKLEREFFHLKDQLAENRDHPAITKDGVRLELMANINGVADAAAATAMGADGIGLYRTEYLYLTHADVPDEDEQFDAYCEVIDKCPNHKVTIRTLDIGGDKTVPYLGHTHQEANPFLGWRSIRLSFEHPEFFGTQIRAILRAGHYAEQQGGGVRLMFPMITTLEEINRLRGMVRRAGATLDKAKKLWADIPVGMMLEVPAAAIAIDTLLGSVDFVSIGSNDLVQYLMAADRDNPKVNHLCQPLAPPVLRVLRDVIATCNAANMPVSLCGEMAGQQGAFVLLLGMGLRNFSMSPAFLSATKSLAKHISIADAEAIVRTALRMKTTGRVRRLVRDQLRKLAPELALMDSQQ